MWSLFSFVLAALVVGAQPLAAAGDAPARQAPQVLVSTVDGLSVRFGQLQVGMSTSEVLHTMGDRPQRQEKSVYLGLEFRRLVWIDPLTGSVYQAVLVAGRLLKHTANTYPLIT